MQSNREAWPCGCTQTDVTTAKGNPLYYDMKPLSEGRVTFGLYTDASCSAEYSGDLDPVEVIENMYANDNNNYYYYYHNNKNSGSVSTLAQQLEAWNSGWDVFKQCQPCKAYDLGNRGGDYRTMYYENGNTYDEYNEEFSCRDDADYTSVNQCINLPPTRKCLGPTSATWALPPTREPSPKSTCLVTTSDLAVSVTQAIFPQSMISTPASWKVWMLVLNQLTGSFRLWLHS